MALDLSDSGLPPLLAQIAAGSTVQVAGQPSIAPSLLCEFRYSLIGHFGFFPGVSDAGQQL
jgi:hypothetical protein